MSLLRMFLGGVALPFGALLVLGLMVVAAPVRADTVKLDFSPQFNAKITRNSAGQACNFDFQNRCFVSERVARDAGHSEEKGLPDDGKFAATKDHPALELAPFNSEGKDAWKAQESGPTSFDVKPAGQYSSIHLVATSGGSAGKKARFRVEMQYDDGTRVTSQEYDVPDWFASPTEPVYVVKGSMDRYRGDNNTGYSAEGKAAIFGVGIATDSSKTLSSITVEIIEIPATFALLGGAATTESFESVTNPPGAGTVPGPDEIIEAIASGGTVIGTECVDGKVDEILNSGANPTLIPYGPDQTLYVKVSGTTRLKRASGYKWNAGATTNLQDKVRFMPIDSDGPEGNSHYIKTGTSENSLAEFGKGRDGAPEDVIPGQGTHQMVFRSVNEIYEPVVLGTMYTATFNTSDSTYSCIPAGLLPPDEPTNVVAEAHASGGMLVTFDQKGPGGDPDYYLYEMLHEGGVADRKGRVVDEQGNDDTSSPFVITPEAALSLTPGQWKVRIQALNAAGESEWSEYSELITPSVEEPPVPEAPVITDVTTANGKATISFIAPEDNGEAITNYAYRLTREFDDPGEYEELDPPITTSPFTLAGLNNGETYTVSIAAINANGMGPDSKEKEFTVGTQCDAVTDWTAPANTMGYFCSVGLDDYAYADFHILTTIDNPPSVCAENKLPTADNNGAGLFCQQNETSVRALFDWGWGNNSGGCSQEALQNTAVTEDCLHWLQSVSQFGSRAAGTDETSGLTASGRVPNQLADGELAFARFAGTGGSGFKRLDTSNLTSLRYAFARAKNFNEDISAWNTAKVSNLNKVFWMSGFNRAIPTNGSAWDVSQVHNFAAAFANSAFDQDLSSWDVGKASSFLNMFINNIHFNQNLSAWADKLTQLTTMENMFKNASAFNNGAASGASGQPLNWGAAPKLERMNYAFANATSFNQQIFADGASTASVENMSGMFKYATAFNQDIGGWNTQSLQKTASMFEGATAFNKDIGSWSTGLITNMNAMFKNAEAFNQDLSGWTVGNVTDISFFDAGADAWCGLGFDNRGRPGGWDPLSDGVSCAVMLAIDAPPSVVAGEELTYLLKYHNESSSDFDGTLTLELPKDVSVLDGGISNDGKQSGRTITWEKVKVPAGSSPEGGGGGESVRVGVAANVTDGTELLASATLDDGFETSVNDPAKTTVSAKSVLRPTIDEAAETVLPGEVIEYSLSVKNVGQSPTEGGDITLTWAGDVPFTIEGKGGATCNGTSCRWEGELAPNDLRSQTVQIRIGVDATANATLTATLSASATNELEAADSNASVTTEILALPLPELNVDLSTLPQGVVDVGAQFTAFVDLSNTGNGPAGSTTVTLDIGSATYVGAAVGNAPSYDRDRNAVTWTVSDLGPSELKGLAVTLKAPEAVGAVLLKSEVSTTTAAGNVITDSASRSLSVTGTAVLDLQLSLDPEDQLLPGDELNMAFGFQNIGNAAALEVVLATETPVDTTLLAWPDYATCAGSDCSEGYTGAISLNLGTVLAKETAVARLSVLVNETAEEQTLSVAGSLTGTNTVGDALVPQAAAASVRVAAVTEDVLAVSQRADRQTVAPGQVVVYEITYQNLSIEAVSNVTLTDVLPKDTRLLNQTGGTVTIDPDTQETTWQLTIESLGSLETGKVLLQVEVAGNAVIGTLDNSVSISTADSTVWADPAEVQVVANAAVLESSISNPESTAPGDSFTYALRYANTGTLVASNTTLQMQVEDGVTVTDCDDCSKTDGGRLSWSLSALAAGADQTKQITVLVDPSVAANSELHAISYIGDSQSAGAVGVSGKLSAQQQRRRGSASATQATSAAERAGPLGVSTIRVGEKASPALGGLKIVAPTQVVAGDPVAVTVAFGNTGGAPATGVKLTSTVPTNSTLTRVEGGSCSADPCVAGETITWNVGEVAAESTREVSYSLTADSDAAGSVIGHRVVLNSAESREASASANTDVVAEKLSVSIAVQDAAGNDAEGSIVGVGDTLTYTLTLLNNSPTGRSGITVVNSVPPAVAACGQACIGGDGKGAAIDAEAGTLTWSNFELDPGAEVTLDYQVTIPSGLANNTPLINSVSVSTAARFYDSALSTVTVAAQAELALSMTAPSVLQDGAQGDVTLSYQNTGTAATAATLRYVLPNNATMIDSANATVSGSTYTWNLGDVAVTGAGSRTVTIEASGAADSSLLHTASVTGTETSDTAEATTVIGLREELALSLTAPGSVNTDAGFTASLTAQNTGNAAANATALSLTLPAGFTASALDGGTLDSAPGSQVVRWSVNLASGASVTLSPTVTAPSAAGKAVLLAGLTAISGKTQSASADVQVTMAASAIITAGAQFSVAEAKAGDSVTLIAGPANVGGAASGTITNTVILSAGLTATAFDGASWNADTRVLSWTTSSLSSRGSDPKNFTVRVEDAGALTATANSNGAEGTATMIRTFPEEVTITPENPGSSCKISGQPVVAAAPTPPEGITLSFANTVGFTVVDCDRNPNTSYPETLTVTIDVGQDIAADAKLYKVSDAGAWAVIEDAVITGQTVTYSIADDGDLDQDKTPGTLRDPVALAVPPPYKPPLPVSLPIWLLAALMGSVGWLGYRRLRLA